MDGTQCSEGVISKAGNLSSEPVNAAVSDGDNGGDGGRQGAVGANPANVQRRLDDHENAVC
jgi:hypothetical protein